MGIYGGFQLVMRIPKMEGFFKGKCHEHGMSTGGTDHQGAILRNDHQSISYRMVQLRLLVHNVHNTHE